MSDPVRPQRRQPTRLPHPWDSPGKNTGVGCHFPLQCVKGKREASGGYFRQCDRLIRDQNQHHFNCTRYYPIKQPRLLQSTPVSALCSHDDISSVTVPSILGIEPRLKVEAFAFPSDELNSMNSVIKLGLGHRVHFIS